MYVVYGISILELFQPLMQLIILEEVLDLGGLLLRSGLACK